MRFNLLWFLSSVAVVGVGFGWYSDRQRLSDQLSQAKLALADANIEAGMLKSELHDAQRAALDYQIALSVCEERLAEFRNASEAVLIASSVLVGQRVTLGVMIARWLVRLEYVIDTSRHRGR